MGIYKSEIGNADNNVYICNDMIKDRLNKIFREKSLTAVKFAELMGIQPSNVSHLLSGRNKQSYDFLMKFMETFPDIDLNWFLTGKGEMFGEKNEKITEKSGASRSVQADLFRGEAPLGSAAGKIIEKIIVFYSDRSFRIYRSEEEG